MKRRTALLVLMLLCTILPVHASETGDEQAGSFYKEYTASEEGAISPDEEISFQSGDDSGIDNYAVLCGVQSTRFNDPQHPDAYQDITAGTDRSLRRISGIYIPPVSVNGSSAVEVPFTSTPAENYPDAGIYWYAFREKSSDTAGVTTDRRTYQIAVMIEYDESGRQRFSSSNWKQPLSTVSEEGYMVKASALQNTFSTGSLSISKEVKGNLASRKQTFPLTLTLHAPEGKTVRSPVSITSADNDLNHPEFISEETWQNGTCTVSLEIRHGAVLTLHHIPAGTTWSLSEEADSYNSSITPANGTIQSAITDEVKLINERNGPVNTGVFFDYPKLFLILAGSLAFALYLCFRVHHV